MRDDEAFRRGADAGAPQSPAAGWHALILIRVDQFPALRRAVGVSRAEEIVTALAQRIDAALPGAKVELVARDLVQARFLAADPGAFAAATARVRALAAGDEAGPDLIVGGALREEPDELALVEAAELSLAGEAPVSGDPTTTFIADELPGAIARGELFLHYQPKLHVRRQAITSVEALVRWLHPQRGLILPGEFIPAAEASHIIEALTLWTLEKVAADQRELMRNGHDLPVFVNIAGTLLSNTRFLDAVLRLVAETGARFGFEITETSVIREPETAIRHLQQLADVGIRIAIDDYGAGLSSLAYLKQLPASELKIDKLFVTQLSSSHRDPLIVRSTIDLAHALEMEVVAEGVETPTSLALLSVMGCDMVQGYLISRPLALEGLLAYLREARHRAIVEAARSPADRLMAVRARA